MKNELKLYIMNLGYYGMIIVTATSEVEARQKMGVNSHYDDSEKVMEFEITSDLQYVTYLDS